MSFPKIIIDTNVILSGLRSKLGASYRLLELIPEEKFEFYISPALILEYEYVLKRNSGVEIKQTEHEIDDILDYLFRAIPPKGSMQVFDFSRFLLRPTKS